MQRSQLMMTMIISCWTWSVSLWDISVFFCHPGPGAADQEMTQPEVSITTCPYGPALMASFEVALSQTRRRGGLTSNDRHEKADSEIR